MNVLLLSLYFPPDWNGASARAFNCAKALILAGCHVTVISAFPTNPNSRHSIKYKRKLVSREQVDEINIIRTWVPDLPHSPINMRLTIYFSFMFSCLLGFLFVRKIDIIFSMNPSFFAFFPALVYSIVTGKAIIRNVDDLWPEVFYDMGIVQSKIFKMILDNISKITYRIPKIIVPVSRGYVETLTGKYQVSAEKIVVIEHGVDLDIFKPKLTKEKNAPKGKKLVIYSGNISEAYDLVLIIEAAEILIGHPIHFIIRGSGPLAGRVESAINEHGLSNVEVKTGLISQNDLVSFLSKADIFLLPMNTSPFGETADRGLPTKILEYQALRRPIICVSKGEAARYVSETKSGLATSNRDPHELAELILRLADNRNLSEMLGENGFQYIINNLSLEMIGKRFMEVIYKSIR